jgi:hypothetical protein
MVNYIIKYLLSQIIKHLKVLSRDINKIIKYLSRRDRFSSINKKLQIIKSIIIYFKSTRIYKFYRIYNRTLKLIAFLNFLLVLSFTKFQIKIEVDYIALIAFISTILSKIINKLGINTLLMRFKDTYMEYIYKFINNINDPTDPKDRAITHSIGEREDDKDFSALKGKDQNIGTVLTPQSQSLQNSTTLAGGESGANTLPLGGESSISESSPPKDSPAVSTPANAVIGESSPHVREGGNNKTYLTISILLGICLGTYLCFDIYTQGFIYTTFYKLVQYSISPPPSPGDREDSSPKGGPDCSEETEDNFDLPDAISRTSSNDSSRTITPSFLGTHDHGERVATPPLHSTPLNYPLNSPPLHSTPLNSPPHSPTLHSTPHPSPAGSTPCGRGEEQATAAFNGGGNGLFSLHSNITIPANSRIIEVGQGQSVTVTPDNLLIFTDVSRSPLGSSTHVRYILDRNNNTSITEILTAHSDNSWNQGNLNAPVSPATLEVLQNTFNSEEVEDILDILND